jgi:HK97 family phage major capsid protein
MKRINDLTVKKNAKLNEMKELVEQVVAENRSKDEDETKRYDALDKEVKSIESQIKELENLEELNKKTGAPVEVRSEESQPISYQFRDWLRDAVHKNITSSFNGLAEYRADPILTSTDTAVITKTVAGKVDILTSPAEAFLRDLGVTFYSGLVGNFIVPSMAQDTATFVGEDVSALSADMATSSLTLAARRVSHTQMISRETLAQTNPGIYASILQNLVNGVWNAVTNDVFDTLDSDGASAVQDPSSNGSLNYAQFVQQEASLGGLNVNPGSTAYVTTPSVKAFAKKTIALGTTAGPAIWVDNEINGYRAFGVPAANTNRVYFGDFSRECVGQWGGLEVIVDPYSGARQGEIKLTMIGLFDSGCYNPRAFCIYKNVSIG